MSTLGPVTRGPEPLRQPVAVLEATVGAELSNLKLTLSDENQAAERRLEALSWFKEHLAQSLRVMMKNRAGGTEQHPTPNEAFRFRGLLYADGTGEFGTVALDPGTGPAPEGSLEFGIQSVIEALDAI